MKRPRAYVTVDKRGMVELWFGEWVLLAGIGKNTDRIREEYEQLARLMNP